jgi:hypothetical protein
VTLRAILTAPARFLRYVSQPGREARGVFDAKSPSEKAKIEDRSRGMASFLPAFVPREKPRRSASDGSQE